MLVMGERNQKNVYKVHLREYMLKHQELILAVKDQIKPGIFSIMCQSFKKQQVKDYFHRLVDKRN